MQFFPGQGSVPILYDINGVPAGIRGSDGKEYAIGAALNDPTQPSRFLGLPLVYSGVWANRPAAASYNNAQIFITDIGAVGSTVVGSLWRTGATGDTFWHPLNGTVTLAQNSGSVATPLASLTGNLALQLFSTGGCTVPIGMIFPGCEIMLEASIARTANAGGVSTFLSGTLGTANSTADALFVNVNNTAGATQETSINAIAGFSSLTNYVGRTGIGSGLNSNSAAARIDRAITSNATAALFGNIELAATAAAGDTFALMDYRWTLRG